MRTAITELFGIRHPLVLAPMGGASGGALAAAVTRAGGLGLLGAGYSGADWIEQEFLAAGNEAVGIGFITWHMAQHPEQLERALAHKPRAVMFSFGDPAPHISRAKAIGAKVLCQVQSVRDAKAAAAAGADVIIAQGGEAGGHGASRGTIALVPAVVDAVAPLPVIAAGGIADGRGIAAAFMLGAEGVLLGTRFLASAESLASPATKASLAAGSGDETLRTTIFDLVRGYDWPTPYTGRALANDFTRSWHGREADLKAALVEEEPRYQAANAAGDLNVALTWAGEGVDLIRDAPPAAALVERLMAEAEACLARRR